MALDSSDCGGRWMSEDWPLQPGSIIIDIAMAATRHRRIFGIVVASTQTGPKRTAELAERVVASVSAGPVGAGDGNRTRVASLED